GLAQVFVVGERKARCFVPLRRARREPGAAQLVGQSQQRSLLRRERQVTDGGREIEGRQGIHCGFPLQSAAPPSDCSTPRQKASRSWAGCGSCRPLAASFTAVCTMTMPLAGCTNTAWPC